MSELNPSDKNNPSNPKDNEPELPPDHPTSTDQPFSSVASVNEPHGSEVWEGDVTPGDGTPPSGETPEQPPVEPPPERITQNPVDPDELEDEIDEAEDDDDVEVDRTRTRHVTTSVKKTRK